jgi:hypothetical protein
MLDNRWTMTCEYGLQRTGQTLSIDLWVRRFPFAVAHVAALRVTLDEQPSGTSGSPVNADRDASAAAN